MRKYLLGVLVGVLPVLLFGQNRKLIANLGLSQGVYHLEVRPDGRRMAASDDEVIKEWDILTGQQTLNYVPNNGYVYYLKYKRDGSLIAVTKKLNTVYINNVITGKNLLTYELPPAIKSSSFSIDADGKYLAIIHTSGMVLVVDIQSGKDLYSFTPNTYKTYSPQVDFSPDGKYLATSGNSKEKVVKIWNAQTGTLLHTLPSGEFLYNDFSFSPDSKFIITPSLDENTIGIWNLTNGKQTKKFVLDEEGGFSYTADGKSIAIYDEYALSFIDANTGKTSIDPGWHTDEIIDIAFSTDNNQIITSSYDKTSKIWDAETGKLIHTLRKHQGSVNTSIYSPNGKYIATGDSKGEIVIWREKNYKVSNTLTVPNSQIITLSFSSDSKYLASGTNKSEVIVLETKTGKRLYTLSGHNKIIRAIRFSPDDNYIAVFDDNKTVTIWDTRTRKVVRKMEGNPSYVNLNFLSEKDLMITLKEGGQFQVWDVQSGQIKNRLNLKTGWTSYLSTIAPNAKMYALLEEGYIEIRSTQTGAIIQTIESSFNDFYGLKISPDGTKIVCFDEYNYVSTWDIQSGKRISNIGFNLNGEVERLRFSPNNRWLITGSSDNSNIELVAFPELQQKYTIQGYGDGINALSFSPDGKYLAVGYEYEKTIKIWDVNSMRLQRSLPGHIGGTRTIAYSSDGNLIASYGSDNDLNIWNLNTGQLERQFTNISGAIRHLEFSPNGKWLVSSGYSEKIIVWEVSSGRVEKELEVEGLIPRNASFSSDGTKLVFANTESTIDIYETRSWKHIRKIQDEKGNLSKVGINKNGDSVIGAGNGYIKVWDLATGTLQRTMQDGVLRIRDFDFSPNGEMLVSGGDSKTLNLWDFESGNLIYSFSGHHLEIVDIQFSPNGNLIASGGWDKHLKIWDVNSRKELASGITFENGKGWATISPDGKYTANSTGLKYLNYIANNQAYPLSSNDPNHIDAFNIPLSSLSQTLVQVKPPIVRWLNRPDPILNTNIVILQAKIESEGPLFGHYVFHNNERIESTFDPATQTISCTIDAEEGEDNAVYIEAINQGGRVKSSPVQFKYAAVGSRKSYALIFAVENYEDDYTWQQLPNVINGAQKLETELETNYGFDVELLEDPTNAQMEAALQKYASKSYNPQDQLLILFTGHGDIQKRGNRDVGFLVASDAKSVGNSRLNYFRHSDLEFEADGMDCKHVLVVLDACFSSTFGTSINTAITGANPKGTYLQPQLDDDQQIQKFLSKKSRLYISSGQSETLSGTKYKASPFFEEFLKALQSRKNKEDGMVSFEEIKVDIMRARLTPEPKGGRFGGHEAEGTFLFIQEK